MNTEFNLKLKYFDNCNLDWVELFIECTSEINIGDVVIIDKEGDENFEREGPVVGRSGDYKTGEKIDVHFEDHVKRYDLKEVSPTGQSIPEGTIDKLPKYKPINVPKE